MKKEHLQFTCPECGSHHYGSSGCTGPEEDMTGHCHGYITHRDGSRQPCRFTWPRHEDMKYFKGTGEFYEVEGIGVARQ